MTRHRKYEQMIPLLLYHELTEMQEKQLNEHLTSCDRCREIFNSTRGLHALLQHAPAPSVSEPLIREARLRALAAVNADRRRVRPATARPLLSGMPALQRWAVAAGTVGILVVTFVAGRLTSPAPATPDDGTVRVTNIRLSGSGDRIVDATFDLVRHVELRGSMDDPRIQKVLASALVDGENPGVRLRAVSSVTSGSTLPADREVRTALMLAARTDRNDAVRKEALQALLRYPPDREIRDVLLEILTHDPNAGLRITAITGLDSLRMRGFGPDPSQLRSVRDRVQNEQNLFVRVKAQSFLEENIQ